MSVVIRLARAGAKKEPYFHIVVADKRSPRDGKFIEVIGAYDPDDGRLKFNIDGDRLQYWRGVGAQMSETVSGLLKKFEKVRPVATA